MACLPLADSRDGLTDLVQVVTDVVQAGVEAGLEPGADGVQGVERDGSGLLALVLHGDPGSSEDGQKGGDSGHHRRTQDGCGGDDGDYDLRCHAITP